MAFMNVTFFSPALKRTVSCNVIMPTDKSMNGTDYEKVTPCKTLYLLHGIYGSCNDWVQGTRVKAWASAANLCVVMPSGENKFYSDSAISGDMFGEFITRDLVNFIENTFDVSRKREDRFIAGLSMGGFGAVTNGLRHPEVFGVIAGMSSAFIKDRILRATRDGKNDFYNDVQYCTMMGISKPSEFVDSANDYDWLACRVAAETPELKPKMYLCCGTEDGLYPMNVAYRDLLNSLGYDLTWEEWPGNHNWQFWDESIEKIIAWLPLGKAEEGISSGNVKKV